MAADGAPAKAGVAVFYDPQDARGVAIEDVDEDDAHTADQEQVNIPAVPDDELIELQLSARSALSVRSAPPTDGLRRTGPAARSKCPCILM